MRTLLMMLALVHAGLAEEGWKPLLENGAREWAGDKKWWKVKDGVVTGEAGDHELPENIFFVWEGGEPDNFELKFQARVSGDNNSGMQYRSREVEGKKHVLAGYQMDLHPNQPYLAMIYEERGRGILCERGNRVRRTAAGENVREGELPRAEVTLSDWNEYRIEAKGPVLRHYVNGVLELEFRDEEVAARAAKGRIGIQLHSGPAMKVEVKEIFLRELGEVAEEEDTAPETSGIDASGSGFRVAPGFRLEKLHQVTGEEGSWVAMTVDGKGRLICADQYGGLFRYADGQVTKLSAEVWGVQGLLWNKGHLYAMVNEGDQASGVWRMREQGDGFGKAELIKGIQGRGEHGPHALVPSPDGKWIYVVAGNFTEPPEVDFSWPAKVWGEDQLVPRNPDGRGHAADRMAPGGWIARFSTERTRWELVAMGLRNSYDIAFNDQGDLFVYDSDMEWDMGMPWYRPTRITHVVPGVDFGWRNGTGKWPAYYEDSIGSLLDIGPGSPTGLLSGRGLKFPAKYQRAIYALDWTYATIHAVHLERDGEGYKATSEELVAGTALPLTDAVAGPDGAMYFTAGGRRTESSLWKLSYVGNKSTEPVEWKAKEEKPRKIDEIWEAIGSDQRSRRVAARLELERLRPREWKVRLEREGNGWRILSGSIALTRVGDEKDRPVVSAALRKLKWDSMPKEARLAFLRAWGLAFIRTGTPTDEERNYLLGQIDRAFPAGDKDLDAELCRMLCYLQAPGIAGRTLTLMRGEEVPERPKWLEIVSRNQEYGASIERMFRNHPPMQQIHFAYCLRVVKGPWTPGERKALADWFERVEKLEGGMSYGAFLSRFRKDFLETWGEDGEGELASAGAVSSTAFLENLPPIEGPGRAWTVKEVEAVAANGLEGRDLERGKNMFKAGLCAACHRFGGEGGAGGPDLSVLGGRFSIRDIAESIIEPNKVISDQYAFETIVKKDGSSITGKILGEKDEVISLATNPFDFSQTIDIVRSEVKEVRPSPVSPMPAGLINRMNEEELKDFLAYITGKSS